MSTRRTLGAAAVAYPLLVAGAVLTLFPYLWMILSSFKLSQDIFTYPPRLLPTAFTADNYVRAVGRFPFLRYYGNSLYVAVVETLIPILTCSLAGFVFGKYRFRGRSVLFALVLAITMIPAWITYVPLYLLTVDLGLINRYAGVFLPHLMDPFGIFLFTQFMHGVPDELLDAGRVDGASNLRLFRTVVFPLSLPAVATFGILQFLQSWNNLLWPLIVLNSTRLFTLPMGIAQFTSQNYAEPHLIYAAACLASLPALLVFLLLQRFIVAGISFAGLKS